jgi:hypothetical protein
VALPREPDLNLVRLVRPPARRCQVAEGLIVSHDANVLPCSRMSEGCLQRLLPVDDLRECGGALRGLAVLLSVHHVRRPASRSGGGVAAVDG